MPVLTKFRLRSLNAGFLAWVCASVCAQSLPDISSVTADLRVPDISDGPPGAGKRVRVSLRSGQPEIILYLPEDWEPRKKFPVLVELPGNGGYKNEFGDISSGLPEDSKLGYGLSGGRGFIWACVPFLKDGGENVASLWWGDKPTYRPDSTVDFLKRTVPALCEKFSGDPKRVILCGFSRGSIATNAIGLHDDEIAGLWRAQVCYSHYDGVQASWPFLGADSASAKVRLSRLNGRPQLICSEYSLAATRHYLKSTGVVGDFTFLQTGFRNHNDAWLLRPSAARETTRAWLTKVIHAPPAR